MTKFSSKVIDPIGLHARPASKIVAVAAKFESQIKISVGERTGNLKSIMNIMALGVKQGQDFTIEAIGDDAAAAVEEIKKTMLENNLIEE